MEQRGKNDFSDVAVENAIQDLKRIQVKQFDNQSLAKLSPVDQRNNNFFEEENNNVNNNKLDDNGNLDSLVADPKVILYSADKVVGAWFLMCGHNKPKNDMNCLAFGWAQGN